MKVFSLILVVAVLTTGCGAGVHGLEQDYGDLEPYVAKVEALVREREKTAPGLRSIPIRFAELDPGETGRCEWNLVSHRAILLDEKFWTKADDDGRMALLLHEVGHCVYHREHDDNKVNRKDQAMDEEEIPKSLMHPQGVSGRQFRDHRDYYLEEYFR